ncbi:hypothetical protein Ndes2526B_g06135 [Nannochloris sp. 'desiccata']
MHLVRNKKRVQIQQLKAEVAEMMKTHQEVNARIRVEEVIRQEWLVSVYATLETYLLLLQTRAGMLKKAKEPPPDMLEAINTIFFAAERVKYELDEMPAIADMLMSKFRSALCQLFNKEFPVNIVEENTAQQMEVSPTVIAGLSVFPAKGPEKLAKLQQIAKEFNVEEFDLEEYTKELILVNPRMPPAKAVNAQPINTNDNGGQGAYTYVAKPSAASGQQPQFASAPAPAPNAAFAPAPPVVIPLAAGAFGPRIPDPFADIPSGPPTRPPGVARVPSKKDPWEPLPPQKVNLGYGFSERLDTVAQNMASKRTSSADATSLASGQGDSQEFNSLTVAGRTGSVTSNPPPQQAAQQAQQQEVRILETVVSSELPQVPTTTSAAAETAAAADEDDLLIRLARLKGL